MYKRKYHHSDKMPGSFLHSKITQKKGKFRVKIHQQKSVDELLFLFGGLHAFFLYLRKLIRRK
ncbi:MAG: hypothetical protein LBH82_04945, partial [Bacteroidales bacterium]|nr:hypothetical protein [Bacteroidales bacterium]